MKISALLGLFALLAASALPAQPGDQPARFALTGDCLITQKISVFDEPEFIGLIDGIRGADVAFTSLESLFHDYESYASTEGGGTYVRANPALLKDILWAGFDIVGMANNHAVDYGAEGLLVNLRHVRESGLVYAGVGEDLTLARAPGHFDSRIGRVAVISCASTFPSFGMAGPSRSPIRGRPGLNPLRFTTTYKLDADGMAALKTLAAKASSACKYNEAARVTFLGNRFELFDTCGVVTAPVEQDLREITAGIRSAKRQADWVVVSVHCHEMTAANREKPPQHLEIFAHAAIDAGADIVAGSGPHVLRGVEVYRGRPIFYSLGNFVFQNETAEFLPEESYLALGLGPNALPADLMDARYKVDTAGFPVDAENWQSVVAFTTFRADKLEKIELWPIALGQKRSRPQRGRPVLADAATGEQILQRLSDLSAPYGTKITIRNGRGIVIPSP